MITTPTTNNERDALIYLIHQHLTCTYVCTRVWEAWNVGMMSQDDFESAADSDLPHELADAILAALSTPTPDALPVVAWMGDGDFYTPNSHEKHGYGSEPLCKVSDALAAIAARSTPPGWQPTEAAISALKRFEETCADGEGYDVPKDTMRNLSAIGLIYRTFGNRYCITDYGIHILKISQAAPLPPEPAGAV